MPLLRAMIVRRTELALRDLEDAVARVPASEASWSPAGGRSALEIVRECAEQNERWASILHNGEWVGYDPSREAPSLMPTLAVARAHLRTTTAQFLAEVQRFPQDRMTALIRTPEGDYEAFAAMTKALTNLNHACGQVEYLLGLLEAK